MESTLAIPPEVWDKGQVAPHLLKNGRYTRATSSALVPELDFSLLSKFSLREDQLQAAKQFVAALRGH